MAARREFPAETSCNLLRLKLGSIVGTTMRQTTIHVCRAHWLAQLLLRERDLKKSGAPQRAAHHSSSCFPVAAGLRHKQVDQDGERLSLWSTDAK